jgi:mono/diheme cytochrome c family protein
MFKKIIILLVAVVSLCLLVVSYWLFTPIQPTEPDIEVKGDARNGAYLARMSGCIACHTDPDSGNGLLAGGPVLSSDFGSFAAPNLTPDPEHGIGNWTKDQFAIAIRQGISPEGEPYYPAFPYEFYRAFSDQDIADLWAAFKGVKARNVPDPMQDIPFPFSIRSAVKGWQAVFAQPTDFTPNPAQSDAYNRGGFIVEGPAHCAACHTPRNFAGSLQVEQALFGNDNLPDEEYAPPIDAESLLKKGWTVDDLAYAMQTGSLPNGDALGGSMGEVILGGTQYLKWSDLTAMAEYLLTPK